MMTKSYYGIGPITTQPGSRSSAKGFVVLTKTSTVNSLAFVLKKLADSIEIKDESAERSGIDIKY